MNNIRVINLAQKLSLFSELWSPKIIAELNESHVKLAKLKGEFIWHKHDNEDELFLVISGELRIELRSKTLAIKPGELVVIPKGIEHRPTGASEVAIVLIEPKGTLNTGNVPDTKDNNSSTGDWL